MGTLLNVRVVKPLSKTLSIGDTRTRLHNIWNHLRYRCSVKSNKNYKWYGAKGVYVCEEWDDYLKFKEWSLSNGYDDTKELDKDIICNKEEIEPKYYSPETCMWVTKQENLGERHGNIK